MEQKVVGLSKVVELSNGEKVVVKKLPLGDYAKLMYTFKNLPKNIFEEFTKLDPSDNEAAISTMFGFFADAWGQMLEILAIGTGIDRERLENDPAIGLDGGVKLLMAVIEVNNLKEVVKNVKNLFAGAGN